MGSKAFSVGVALLLIIRVEAVIYTGQASVKNSCKNSFACGWESDKECPKGKQLIFTEIEEDVEQAYCCSQGYEHVEIVEKHAEKCRKTECKEDLEDLCSTLPTRIFKEFKLEYKEVFRESCPLPRGGRGYTALCCDSDTSEGIIVSTVGAESNEFPFIAKLNPKTCAGTIYDKRHIITAAHCVVDEIDGTILPLAGMTVQLGTNLGSSKYETRQYKVKKVIPHPKYSGLAGQPEFENYNQSERRIFNDIAIVRLGRDILFEDGKIQPIQIAPHNFNPSRFANKVLRIGRGVIDTFEFLNLEVSEHLHKANLVLRNDDVCFHPYEKRGEGKTGIWFPFTTNCSCVGYTDPVPDAAEQLMCVGGIADGVWSPTAGAGDSGGPTICRDENGYGVLCGVISFGANDTYCQEAMDDCPPSVFADVSYFRDWIIQTTGRKQGKTGLFKAQLYGETVPQAQYPHQVHITSSDGKTCGGTLVKKDTVITAAQCIATAKHVLRPDVEITTGIFSNFQHYGIRNNGTGVQWFDGWRRAGRSVKSLDQGDRIVIIDDHYHNDIAVVKLDGEVDIHEGKLPTLPHPCECREIPKTGIELSFPLDKTNFNPGEMMKREFRLLKDSVCRSRLESLEHIGVTLVPNENIICGIEKFSGGSTCDRELGGGLICKGKDGKDVLCGVQVFRLCESTIPNGFVNVARFVQSIRI